MAKIVMFRLKSECETPAFRFRNVNKKLPFFYAILKIFTRVVKILFALNENCNFGDQMNDCVEFAFRRSDYK